ncbi:hypothetical protein D3C76_1558800 [compost metagenome]
MGIRHKTAEDVACAEMYPFRLLQRILRNGVIVELGKLYTGGLPGGRFITDTGSGQAQHVTSPPLHSPGYPIRQADT